MILIQNIYYMLSYAFKVLQEKGYRDIDTEEFENVADLLSEILIKGVKIELKRGILKGYVDTEDTLSTIRGKINIRETINHQTLINNKVVCNYDEYTENIYLNKIIKTTMLYLLHSDISKDRKKKIKNILVYFKDVDVLDIHNINWKINYNKNNQNYRMLIYICNFIIKGLIQTKSNGKNRLLDFEDEQKMSSLYEKFILEYYRKEHPEVIANASFINWQLDNDFDLFLPRMRSDITLLKDNKVLIIDAKYYINNMQHYYESDSIVSSNIYQIFTYVKNKSYENKDLKVSGMLLYAKTENQLQPDADYLMSGNRISVKTLDLNQPFNKIKQQLDDIIINYL